MEGDVSNDVITSLRSDLAALQYKREKLISEVSASNFWFHTIKTCVKLFVIQLFFNFKINAAIFITEQ